MDSRRGKRRRRRAGFCGWSNHQAALTAASKPPTVSLVLPNHHAWRHPWLRVQLVIRALTGTRWDAVGMVELTLARSVVALVLALVSPA